MIGAASVPGARGHGWHLRREGKTAPLPKDHQPWEGLVPSPRGPEGEVDVALGEDRWLSEAGGGVPVCGAVGVRKPRRPGHAVGSLTGVNSQHEDL